VKPCHNEYGVSRCTVQQWGFLDVLMGRVGSDYYYLLFYLILFDYIRAKSFDRYLI
jgi:hypothetical protein